MFVPCDENGNVLEKPPVEVWDKFLKSYFGCFDVWYTSCFKYQEAQSKVLFNTDIENDKHIIYFKSKETYQRVEYNNLTDKFFFGLKTIEDCIHLHLELTVSF
jgi:hypothetical protein